jgi:hypothetical protein
VNPVLALALVLAAGLAVTRLPLPHLRHTLSLDLVVAAGAPLVVAGLLLGPGLGVLDHATLRALAPVTALGIGWIGAAFGAQLEWRLLRRVPRRTWALAALQAAVVLVLTALAARLLTRAAPALAQAWRPTLPALLTIAAAAMTSGPAAVALVARAVRVPTPLARALGTAARLDTAFGALVFAFALGLSQPHRSFAGVALGWAHWVAVAVVASGGVGVLFLWVSRLRGETDGNALSVDLLAAVLLGSGLGYATDLSPFIVCALATALIVNLSPQRRRVQALLVSWEPPVYAVFVIVVGALLALPTWWLVPAALLIGLIGVAARWAVMRDAQGWREVAPLPPHLGLATVAQGGVPLALAASFSLIYAGSAGSSAGGGGAILTTVLLGVALSQVIAAPLMALALRPAPPEVS